MDRQVLVAVAGVVPAPDSAAVRRVASRVAAASFASSARARNRRFAFITELPTTTSGSSSTTARDVAAPVAEGRRAEVQRKADPARADPAWAAPAAVDKVLDKAVWAGVQAALVAANEASALAADAVAQAEQEAVALPVGEAASPAAGEVVAVASRVVRTAGHKTVGTADRTTKPIATVKAADRRVYSSRRDSSTPATSATPARAKPADHDPNSIWPSANSIE